MHLNPTIKTGGVSQNIGQVLKYILRVGVKHPDAWKEDMQKAENYLHRVTTGEWMPSIKPKKK